MTAEPKKGGSSPWGTIQSTNPVVPGVWFVHTAGHGGYKLSAEENRKMPESLRKKGGWYEEDAEYAFVWLFHEATRATLSPESIANADKSMRDYWPDEYFALTGQAVAVHESYKLRQRDFRRRHANDWVTNSAIGDWHAAVPKGHVCVLATLGGRDENHYTKGEERAFLVPSEEYRVYEPGGGGFVVDPARHPRLDPKTYRPLERATQPLEPAALAAG